MSFSGTSGLSIPATPCFTGRGPSSSVASFSPSFPSSSANAMPESASFSAEVVSCPEAPSFSGTMAKSTIIEFFFPPSHRGNKSCAAEAPNFLHSSSPPSPSASKNASTVTKAFAASICENSAKLPSTVGSSGSYNLVMTRSSIGEDRWILNLVGLTSLLSPEEVTLWTDTRRLFIVAPPVLIAKDFKEFLMDWISCSASITSMREASMESRASFSSDMIEFAGFFLWTAVASM
mmetsp:Transcript_20924/g.43975  ORF Transcript_20924/g.43975 Transcript_20924/m.43975 type:complete len:234 (+) Transcript_20924:847-1548(+)